jgi:hypothetical protein
VIADAVLFAVAIFCGWLIFDTVKQKKITMETVMSSLILGAIAGVGWFLLDLLF